MTAKASDMIESVQVAIVVPVYNRRRKLIDTLKTVTSQNKSPALLVVVDDGSSDGSAEAAESWLAGNTSFEWKVLRQPNAGAAAARNAGFAEIGELPFVCFLDSDDLWPPEFLAKGIYALEGRQDAVAAVADRVKEVAGRRQRVEDVRRLEANPTLWLLCRDGGILSCSLIRSGAARAAGLFVPGMVASEDSDFLYRLFQRGDVVRSESRPVLFTRRVPLEPTEAPNLSTPDSFPDLPYRWARHGMSVLPTLPKSLVDEHNTLIRAVVAGWWARSAFSCRQNQPGRAVVSLLYALRWDHSARRRRQLLKSFCRGNKDVLDSFANEVQKFGGTQKKVSGPVDRCQHRVTPRAASNRRKPLAAGVSDVKISTGAQADTADRLLDQAKWHQPLCTVIVTHHNYSNLVEDALLSVLGQTYSNWECVVVDDHSTNRECDRLQDIVNGLSDNRIKFIQNPREPGQIETFFAGLAETTGEFVSPLDPDDRLHPAYLEEMVSAHLNETVFCPIVCCEQKLLRLSGELVTGTLAGGRGGRARWLDESHPIEQRTAGLHYFSSFRRGWLWTTTSAMMVRRSAANFLVPTERLAYTVALDAYLAFGAHFLGGTILLGKPLVYRGLHESNDYINETIFSMTQNGARPDAMDLVHDCKRDVVKALFQNGVTNFFRKPQLAKLLRRHFKLAEIALVGEECPEVLNVLRSVKDPRQTKRVEPGFIRRLWGRLR